MARALIVLFYSVMLLGCANDGVKAQFGDVVYDYLIPSTYPLTPQHKNIYLAIDGDNIVIPKNSLNMENVKLNWVNKKNQAQIILHLRISNSFLILFDSASLR